MTRSLAKLTKKLGYEYNDIRLLETALTHSSYGKNNNERLEFLGDSILGWVIAEALYQQFPKAKEGQLSRLRAGLVKGDTLADIAREFQLGDFVRLGQGELKSGGFRRNSTLADTLEAIVGAIFLDAGIDQCRTRILDWFAPRLATLSLKNNLKDPKTRLQEYLQAHKQALPVYRIIATHGKEHEQSFEVACEVSLLKKAATGEGTSRRQAEQDAASNAMQMLGI